jgi:D-serine dehydratase
LIDDLIKTNERVLTFTWERKKQYQLTFKKAKEAIQSLYIIQEIQETQPELIEFASNLLEEFSEKQTGENIIDSYKIVVHPLQDYIMQKAKQHPKVTELLFLTQSLTEEYTGIQLSANHNASDYREYATSLESAATNLLRESEQLRNDFGKAK